MRSFIRNLSAPVEFGLILFLGFGLSISVQIWRIATSQPTEFNNLTLFRGVIFELVALTAVLWIGKIRGWSLATFGFRISWKGTGGGILLFLVTVIAQIGVSVLVNIIHPQPSHFFAVGLTAPFILLLSIANPVFEESLEVGYFVHSLQSYGIWPAVLASSLFRAFLHMYQGVNGMLGILVIGLIFGCVYSKWRQLWPLIVAHSLWDFFALLYFAGRHAS
jgi:membrane protease YdiL (CAAX protease family)